MPLLRLFVQDFLEFLLVSKFPIVQIYRHVMYGPDAHTLLWTNGFFGKFLSILSVH